MSLSLETITAIKETIPLVSQEAENVTTRMYEILFSKYPETKPLFANATSDQHKKLAGAIAAFAGNIDNLGALGNAVEKMAQSHVNTNVKPEHYPMVADALISAMGDVLGEAFTEERKNAWVEAYTFLANILMQREQELYAAR
ncbi:MAG: globin domain-containing protein [Sulfuricurvum sp.]|jgi:nitric oxide dioxygenase|uniref:globin domain-containing protein n=1 Tax=Sulfuricurvum sp. TaxID=2025608 RepID=UPI0025D61EAF|nr:globin domain-containing protein [Sulfuricurvum sp.]MCK9372224.1 globin domain-containing protein [Sulfuricurvum sp.]